MSSFLAALGRCLPPEAAHGSLIRALALGLVPSGPAPSSPRLRVQALGRTLPHPIGLAAGFDKNALVPDAMLRQGFAFVEVGSITPRPQKGNPKPRLFRLAADGALINRLGFNNEGLAAAQARLARRSRAQGPVGANIGMNKDAADPLADYATGLRALHDQVDFLVANVSSPNTPGLRDLQAKDRLRRLLDGMLAVRAAAAGAQAPTPLLLKIAPDLAPGDVEDIVATVLDCGLDGLIVSNTTVARPDHLRGRAKTETGGLSGRPLLGPSTDLLRRVRRLAGPGLLLVGVGGVASGADAYAKIRAGATLVELYTAMVYHGPGIAGRIAAELDALLERDGFAQVRDAVGADLG
ncbi:quinone-dependent dihydroorotate dehydrogenase [Marinivivus vitaminiproducens]|uniref:quinone-dependent dihydroorotate dehydrogenase n=1 Tax=Marinivivus vitaminiproducens TaxID=3035935 RepID=UPI0027A8972F|nr:quinone-dependent dihydroorotate dehydrogenase [Geminicoccaceae bacterium SCSIO 64248]